MKKPIIFILFFALAFAFLPNMSVTARAASAEKKETTLEISAKSGLLFDASSGYVIFEKNSHERLPIASMTKIATLSLVFDALGKGIIHENDIVSVSQTAADVGGSSAFLDAGARYKLCDLIKSVIIASANDSSVALAEFVAGSEEQFVEKMNKLAANLGLTDTHFENCTGLPVKNHYSCAHDIAQIYKTICDNALYRKYSKIWMDDLIHPSGRKTGLVNTNRLIRTFDGIEGGKTGYTDEARFCLTASARRGSTRLIGVIIGANDSKTRFNEMSKLLSYGFANFESKLVVNSEIPLAQLKVNNSKDTADVYAERDCAIFMQKGEPKTFSTQIEIFELRAPVAAGSVVGKLTVFDQNNIVVDEINLTAGSALEPEKFVDIFNKLITVW